MRAASELNGLGQSTMEVHSTSPASYRGDRTPPAERRVVTVLFCDVVGSTGMAELLDPEEWADLMNDAFEKIISPVERYDGTVTRLIGDAVMAIFGAPNAHADDPQRAILAGLDIIEGVEGLSQRIQRTHGFEFNVRVGINTGLAVVGAFGSAGLTEYTAMGDVTNVADRIQHFAAPGTVEVGELTFRLAERYFDFESLGEHEVRGKSESENTYRVLSRKVTTPASHEDRRREMPLFGRGHEIEQIRAAIDGLLRDGRSRIIAIYGEPGIGKSRLAKEAVKYARSASEDRDLLDVTIFENQISPYDAARPYSALQGRIQKVFGIDPDDPASVVKEKFANRSQQFPAEFRVRAARVIQRVMSIGGEDGHDPVDFEQGQFRSELTTVLKQIVRGWNPGGAFMLVGEDYQWSDAASMDALCDVYDVVRDIPAIFLCTFRPEQDARIMQSFETLRERFGDYVLEIPVGPLSQSDACDLLLEVIEGDTVAAESVRLLIQSRAEGNPLFIEELLTALAEQGAIESSGEGAQRWRPVTNANFTDVSLPTSLGALLLERIDRLDPDAKRTLEQAAVLGRTFSGRVLNEIVEADGTFEGRVNTLVEAGIICRADESSADALEFRHSMIQEAAYETILMRNRREFHRRAAESMERIYGDRECEFASAISFHFHEAGDKRAIRWFMRAANHAQTVFEPSTAVEFATKSIKFAEAEGESPPPLAYQVRGQAYDALSDYDAARYDIETVLGIARQGDDREMEWQALIDLGELWTESDYHRAEPHIREALQVAQTLEDQAKVAYSLNRLGNWHVNLGNPARAREAHAEALAIFKGLDDIEGLAETFDLLGLAQDLSGDLISSDKSFRQAIGLFREIGNYRGLTSSLAMLALAGGGIDDETVRTADGKPEDWIAYANESLEIAKKTGWRAGEAFALGVSGAVKAYRGELRQGLDTLRTAKSFAADIGHRQWSIAAEVELGQLAIDLLQWEDALVESSSALAKSRRLGSAIWTLGSASQLARLHIATGALDEAEALLDELYVAGDPLTSGGTRKLCYQAGLLALARGEWSEALDLGDRLLTSAPGAEVDRAIPRLTLLRGPALAALGNTEQAVKELRAALAESLNKADIVLQFHLQIALAKVWRSSDSPELADEVLAGTRKTINRIATELECDPWQDRFLSRANELAYRVSS